MPKFLVLAITLACTLALAAVMIAVRYRIETLLDARQNISEPGKVIAATREPEPAQ